MMKLMMIANLTIDENDLIKLTSMRHRSKHSSHIAVIAESTTVSLGLFRCARLLVLCDEQFYHLHVGNHLLHDFRHVIC